MKNKYKYWATLASILCAILFLSGCSGDKEKASEQERIYIVFNDSLCCDNATFIEPMLGIEAIMLDKQIGKTSDGKQVFSIRNMNPDDYICLRVEGDERVFQNNHILPLSNVKELDFSRLVIRNDHNIEDREEITDKAIIEAVMRQISDENIVTGEVVGEKFRDFTFYSSKLEGMCYKFCYVEDEYGDSYLYDPYLGYAWKFADKLFEIE